MNRFTIHLYLLVFCLLSACNETIRPKEVAETWENGTPKKELEWFNTGKVGSLRELYYFETGELRQEKIFIEGHLEKEKYYAITGEIEAIFVYERGRTVFGTEYYKNGQPMGNVPRKLNGTIHGFVEYFNSDGSVKSSGRYAYNEKEGLWKDFNNDGQVIKESIYNNGELVKR